MSPSARSPAIAFALVIVVAVAVALYRCGHRPPAAPPEMLGTWTLNVAKSHWTGSIRPSKSETHMYQVKDGHLHITTDRVTADGRTIHSEWIGMFDGKDYPNAGEGQTLALTLIDDLTYDFVAKTNGEVSSTTRVVVSADGKTKTGATTAKTFSSIRFYDRQ